MHYSIAVVLAVCSAHVSAHGVVTQIQGANGVNMPGLSGVLSVPFVADSTRCTYNIYYGFSDRWHPS